MSSDSSENLNTSEESNIENHNGNEFQKLIEYGFKSGGLHVVASKGHGKSRLMFSVARELERFSKLYIFDGSETWLYAFDKVPVFTVEDRRIRLLGHNTTTQDLESYAIDNWNLIELALKKYPCLLFRMKTRKPSKRGFFVRQVINYLDEQQRQNRETTKDNEASSPISYIIEEAQDCFNSRSTTRLEAEEFLSVFNEARNQREAFFTASQRLTDFSKTIRTKQSYIFGRINEEDKGSSIRRIETMHNIDLTHLKPRTWFLEGLEKTFTSPEWKQSGKPFQINNEVKTVWKTTKTETKARKKDSPLVRLLKWICGVKDTKRSYGYDDTKEDAWSEGSSDFHDFPSDEDDEDEEFLWM